MDLPAHARFRAWFKWLGITQGQLAERLGCDQSVVSNVLAGKRRMGIDLATVVEAETGDWPRGPILATEWGVDRRRRAS